MGGKKKDADSGSDDDQSGDLPVKKLTPAQAKKAAAKAKKEEKKAAAKAKKEEAKERQRMIKEHKTAKQALSKAEKAVKPSSCQMKQLTAVFKRADAEARKKVS